MREQSRPEKPPEKAAHVNCGVKVMHSKMRSTPYAVAVGVVAMLIGAFFLWVSLHWMNKGAGEAGAGIWAIGSVGMGMLMRVRGRLPAWACEYLHLLIFVPPAACVAWLYSAGTDFPPLFVLNAFLLLVAPVAGFWLGYFLGRDEDDSAVTPGRGNRVKWLAVLLLQLPVVGVPVLLAFSNAANNSVFWFELCMILWFPIGAGVCAAVPWAWLIGLRRPHNWAVRPVCVIGWLFLIGFVVMLAV